jgi:ornithine carbamoyltransferase
LTHLVSRAQYFAGVGIIPELLRGKAVGIYFRNTSTRTRTSFAIGAAKLGAATLMYGPYDLQTNTGETLEDTGRVLAGYLDALVVRAANDGSEIRRLAAQTEMSIINAMSADEHPTQALADLATLQSHFGRLTNLSILYFGEGNNTAVALALAASRIRGMQLRLYTPEGYGLSEDVLRRAVACAIHHGALVEEHHFLNEPPIGADAVYTTRWQTTGTSKPDPNWRKAFAPFCVTQALMARVSKPTGTVFMHDLPAVRGEDVEADVIDGPQSIVYKQSRFKLFSAMAVLEWSILT